MAEVVEKNPSLPANYVSLVQLQQRWLKEQQRKQREKEEEERKQRENEEEDLKREKKEKNTASSYVFNNRRPFRRNWNGEESQSEILKSKKQIGNGERKVSNNWGSFYRNRISEKLQIENVGEKVGEESEKIQNQIVNGGGRVMSNSVSKNCRSFNRKPEESKSEKVRVQDEQIDGESKKKTKSRNKNKREKEEKELKSDKEEKQNNRRPFRWNRNPEELQIENVGAKVEEGCGEKQKQILNGERKFVSNNRQSIFHDLKPEGSQNENVRVQDEVIDGESKKNEKWKKNKRKPRVQENLTGGNQLEEKITVAVRKEAEKRIPVVESKGDSKMVVVRVEYRPKSNNHRPVNQTVEIGQKFDDLPLEEDNARSQGKSYYNHRLVNQTVDIGLKFDDLSLKGGNMRSQRRYNRDSGRLGRPRMEKLREGGQMWVIKRERIDTDATEAGTGSGAVAGTGNQA